MTIPDTIPQLEDIIKLPRTHEQLIPADYIDMNGHVNVMYYTHLGNMGIQNFFKVIKLPFDKFARGERGFFALRQVINYLSEIRQGEHVAVHTGLAAFDQKRLHFFHYIVNLSRQKVASSDERLAMYIDMNTRRSASFEPETVENLMKAQEFFAGTGWKPQFSGAIQIKES
jgi:acyl-CoA thioester hydrolase